MADPFEVRMRFTSQLQHLNASITSSQKAASFVLKHKDLSEDLHSCILEQLEKNSMNNRANIMYFIEHLCDLAQRERYTSLIQNIQRDILQIVDAVAPGDGTGAANVKVVRKVLSALQQKKFLKADKVTEIESALKDRDTLPAHVSPISGGAKEKENGISDSNSGRVTRSTSTAAVNGHATKREIEQRIEEDRVRHKRLRESIWAVKASQEARKGFDEASDIGEDDEIIARQEKAERSKCYATYFAGV